MPKKAREDADALKNRLVPQLTCPLINLSLKSPIILRLWEFYEVLEMTNSLKIQMSWWRGFWERWGGDGVNGLERGLVSVAGLVSVSVLMSCSLSFFLSFFFPFSLSLCPSVSVTYWIGGEFSLRTLTFSLYFFLSFFLSLSLSLARSLALSLSISLSLSLSLLS